MGHELEQVKDETGSLPMVLACHDMFDTKHITFFETVRTIWVRRQEGESLSACQRFEHACMVFSLHVVNGA